MIDRPLNILFLPKWYPFQDDPFDGNFVENHAHSIKQICNIKVAFVHSEEKKEDQVYIDNRYRIEEKDNEGIQEVRVYFLKPTYPFAWLNKIMSLFFYSKAQKIAYKHLYPNSQPDLVHVHVLARSAMLAMNLLKKKNIPFVITEHWSGYLKKSGALKKSGKSKWYRKIGIKAKAIHTVTRHLAKAMQEHGIENSYSVIPNVVKEELFVPRKRIDSDKIQILFVGNLLQHPKRILDIIHTIHTIREQRDDFVLHIYGEGTDEDKMLSLIAELDLKEYVEFHGTANRAGIAEAMAAADFLFLFSEFENQPCVINEALCCGTPVVVPNIEGIKEFMQNDFGIIFKRLDKNSFQEALIKMMDTYQTYDRDRIRSMAVAQFGEEAIAKKFEVFYQKALGA